MKLTVGDISFSESGYALATVKVETGTFPFLLFSACKMVVPVVDGKEINDYREDLKNKARKTITKMYKEIVCGGNDIGEQSTMLIQAANSSSIQMMQASIDELKEQITRLQEEKHPKKEAMKSFLVEDEKIVMNAKRFTIINSPARDNLEERVALLESHLHDAQIKPEVLNAIHANIKKAIMDDSLVVRDADGSVRVRMNAEKQAGLKVTVSDKDDVLWMRDSATQEGIMSLGYLKDGTQQKIITALEDALFQAKGQASDLPDDSVKVDFPVMRLSRYEPKGDSIFDFDKHERIGGNVQVKLVSGEEATLYYEEDLDLKSTFEGYLRRAKEYARKSIKAH
ncbi:hypothetical protein [Salmonella enterica]|uniref:hypothetical protein n=1 Tax=Salmonella enterica TaxID=28901 RepID=UPI00345226FA